MASPAGSYSYRSTGGAPIHPVSKPGSSKVGTDSRESSDDAGTAAGTGSCLKRTIRNGEKPCSQQGAKGLGAEGTDIPAM